MSHLIGVDVGTTRVKAVVYTLDGTVVTSAAVRTPWHESAFGTEMHVEDLNRAVVEVLARASDRCDGVAGVGVTGMGESGVLTGDDHRTALGPIRAWHNQRGSLAELRDACGDDGFRRATGLPLDATASLPKILQMRVDYPATAVASRFYSVPEWVVRYLGGDPGSEWSLASRTGMFDVLTATAWPVAVDLAGTDLLGLPQQAGTLVGRAGGTPGLGAIDGAALAVGGHDHQTAALAAGAMRAETLFDSIGTAEAILRITDADITRDTIETLVQAGFGVGRTVVPHRLCVMGGLSTGMQLERLATSLNAADGPSREGLADDPTWIDGVTQIVAGAVAMLEAMHRCLGPHRDVLAAGGWLHDRRVMEAKRRQLGGLVHAFIDEAGAVGAAYLAGHAAGLLPAPHTVDGPPWPAAVHHQGDPR